MSYGKCLLSLTLSSLGGREGGDTAQASLTPTASLRSFAVRRGRKQNVPTTVAVSVGALRANEPLIRNQDESNVIPRRREASAQRAD